MSWGSFSPWTECGRAQDPELRLKYGCCLIYTLQRDYMHFQCKYLSKIIYLLVSSFSLCCYMMFSIIKEWPTCLVRGKFLSIFQTYYTFPFHPENWQVWWPFLLQQAAWAHSWSLETQYKGDLKSVSYRPYLCLQITHRIYNSSIAGLGVPREEAELVVCQDLQVIAVS